MSETPTTSGPRAVAPLPRIFGRYLLIHRLSRGGMGEIFLARYGLAGFEKLSVIKKVLPHLSADEEFIERFVAEAHVAVKLQHANVAQVFEVGRVGDEYFLALEHIHGRDLRRTLTLLGASGRGMPPDLALFIGREVANALAYAHRRVDDSGQQLGLVHCDISPPNVMMSFDGEVKIIDFGIAKSALKALDGDSKRGFGKFGYMAPEQLIRGREVDSRTDIYALGTVLFEMLTGTRLYEVGDTPDYRALARMVAKGQHPLPSDLDPKLAPYDELVARALKPKANDRYATAAEFRDAIQRELVTLNPTISTDELAAFMRFLFAEDVLRQQEEIERLDKTQLSQWEHELTRESQQTVSFALGHSLDGTHTSEAMTASVDAPVPAPIEVGELEVDDRTALVGRDDVEATLAPVRRRSPFLFPVAAAVLVVGVGLGLAWMANASGREKASKSAALSAASVNDTAGSADREPVSPPVATRLVDAGVSVGAQRHGENGKLEPVASEHKAVAKGAKQGRDPRSGAKSGSGKQAEKSHKTAETRGGGPEDGEADATRTRKKFQRASREYKTFRTKFGQQLESEWTDLLTAAQFGSGGGKAKKLEKKIDRFRAKMRRIREDVL